ncbi:MAG: GH25 family lysozyme, partial [Bacillota bacterium]
IEPYRDKIDLPVALDFETNSGGRLNWRTIRELGKDNCTNLCMTFCDIIADNGYEPMLYASRGLFNSYLDAEKLEDKYAIWLAQYTSDLSATGYKGEYYMWQYSSNVRIPGIRCRFDGNYLYERDYGSGNAPKEIASKEGKTVTYSLSDGVSSVLPVKSNVKVAKAKVTDSYGIVHNYVIRRAEDYKYTDDECIMAGLLSGLGCKYEGSKGRRSAYKSLDAYCDALDKAGVICEKSDDMDNVYLNIKGNLANGMPVIISIDADSGPWRGESQRLLLIGMDEDGRAIVADVQDRKWFETDQRLKLTDADELISYIDKGYIIIRGVQ